MSKQKAKFQLFFRSHERKLTAYVESPDCEDHYMTFDLMEEDHFFAEALATALNDEITRYIRTLTGYAYDVGREQAETHKRRKRRFRQMAKRYMDLRGYLFIFDHRTGQAAVTLELRSDLAPHYWYPATSSCEEFAAPIVARHLNTVMLSFVEKKMAAAYNEGWQSYKKRRPMRSSFSGCWDANIV